MSKTVVGLFDSMAQAEQVKQQLNTSGYGVENVRIISQGSGQGMTSSAGTGTTGSGIASSASEIGEKIGSFFHNMTGGDESTHQQYSAGVHGGGALVAVTVADEQASQVAMLLKQQGARDLQGAGQNATSGYQGATNTTATTTGETTIPVVEEQLVVGKREVDHGGVRIYSHVTERPVEAEVMLREEHIHIDRQPVNRPATEADFQAGNGPVVELNAMAEEAVVGKTSRVVEEVRIGKLASEHSEAVHDTVRKTEVEVERVAETSGTAGSYEDDLATTRNRGQ